MILNKIFPFCIFLTLLSCSQDVKKHENMNLSFEERAENLVSQMTLAEKVSQMSYESPAIDRLEIPEHNWWNECLHGVARAGVATVFPQAIGMAAMWDREQMFEVANAISDEARAKHHQFAENGKRGIYQGLTFWTPNVNIFRDPRWGRGMETYGEDPYLTGELGVQFIKGLQGDDDTYYKVIATAKHFVVHSGPEAERHSFNATPSQYDMLNTYSPHFKKVIQEGGVYSVMCAYNSYNGLPCCGNKSLSNLLREEWGFKGYIVSDCWAINDFYMPDAHAVTSSQQEAAAMAVKAGTDLNCGNSYPSLVEAVKNGLISEAELDISVKRLLLARLKLGLFAPKGAVKYEKISYDVVDSEMHRLLALQTARKSMVLLKNENKLLPLNKSIQKVAVIGSNANDLEVLLGNYNGYPSAPVTPLEGIKQKLPNAEVKYAVGCKLAEGLPIFEAIPASVLFTDETCKTNGLSAEYFNNKELKGEASHTRIDSNVDFIWGTTPPFEDLAYDQFSARWKGVIKVEESGDYALGGEGFLGIKIFFQDSLLISRSEVHHPHKEYEYVHLEANKPYSIQLEYIQDNTEHAMMRLLWEKPNSNLADEAIAIAKEAEVVIFCMGISPLLEGEEMKVKVDGFAHGDRLNIKLPATQTALMKEIKKLGKPMVLVLLNGSALAVNWENENIPAIVEAWYPGQAGGTAIADVLFGDYNPAGRLPLTFYKSVDDIPAFSDYDMKGKTYRYFEGEALYDFGFGLSYSDFTYSNLKAPDHIAPGDCVEISVDVTNNSKIDGEEVIQCYASNPQAGGVNPNRSLVEFQRVMIKAGESKTIHFTIEASQLTIVDNQFKEMVMAGELKISLGGAQPNLQRIKERKVLTKNILVEGSACEMGK
ncbi:glucan 1,4-alpha-glucosidase [Labilibaculum filiforme]|uniref:Glucan 1,4-alpha-glucosidase n=2 Tax=Labilibaculum filiforme TaxID=1940526 RepID=A0A2N3HWP1_9BACT|nr:glucan 1,4-alpha-glucosidase [Labilibaculum filiforme]